MGILSYLFMPKNIALAQLESQTRQTKEKLTAAKSGDLKATYASAAN